MRFSKWFHHSYEHDDGTTFKASVVHLKGLYLLNQLQMSFGQNLMHTNANQGLLHKQGDELTPSVDSASLGSPIAMCTFRPQTLWT